ncbi:hypothetical protein BTHI11S_06304 [Bosea thiooxidans]
MLVIIERVAGEEEADRLVLALELLGRRPGLDLRDAERLLDHAAAEEIELAGGRFVADTVRKRQHAVDRRHRAGAILLQLVERPGGDERFQRTAIDQLGVDAAREIGKVAEGAARLARRHH